MKKEERKFNRIVAYHCNKGASNISKNFLSNGGLNMKVLQKALIVFLLLISLVNVWAARPFSTDDTGTVEVGGYELETGYDIWEGIGTLGVGFKHGITEKMDIGIGFGYNIVTQPKNSFLPAEFCFKYALIPDMFAASFTAEIGGSSYAINTIFSRIFGPLEFDANLGYTTGDSTITYAGALIYNLDKINFGMEFLGDKENKTWLLGARYIIKEGIMVDAGFTSDFNFEEKTATSGLHCEF